MLSLGIIGMCPLGFVLMYVIYALGGMGTAAPPQVYGGGGEFVSRSH